MKKTFSEYFWSLMTGDQQRECAARVGLDRSTLYRKVKAPGTMRVSEAENFVAYVNECFDQNPKWRITALVNQRIKPGPQQVSVLKK